MEFIVDNRRYWSWEWPTSNGPLAQLVRAADS